MADSVFCKLCKKVMLYTGEESEFEDGFICPSCKRIEEVV